MIAPIKEYALYSETKRKLGFKGQEQDMRLPHSGWMKKEELKLSEKVAKGKLPLREKKECDIDSTEVSAKIIIF